VRERRRLLEHDPDARAQLRHVLLAIVNIVAVEGNQPVDPRRRDGVVHAVQAAQERGFAAARRADQRQHLIASDVETDIFDGVLVAIMNVDAACGHHRIAHLLAGGHGSGDFGGGRLLRHFGETQPKRPVM
jgi:hypothetical protein